MIIRRNILFAVLLNVICLSCINKQQRIQSGTTSDEKLAIIGGNDTTTSIQVIDKDTIVYDTPECYLWYVKDLPDEYKDKPVSMWVEHTVYGEDVQTINVFVSNPMSISLMYGRDWWVEQWNGMDWVPAKAKEELVWFDDGFEKQKAPLLYCFHFPVGAYYYFQKGKYRINKWFYAKGKEMELSAEFEIK